VRIEDGNESQLLGSSDQSKSAERYCDGARTASQDQERRFRAAGYEVVCAANRRSALDYVRHHALEGAVILSRGSALSVAETILSLKDLCPAMKIVLVLRRGAQPSDRFIRQLMNHPIQGSKIITRRELQKRLREQAPKGLF
jgi:hypothetical protein